MQRSSSLPLSPITLFCQPSNIKPWSYFLVLSPVISFCPYIEKSATELLSVSFSVDFFCPYIYKVSHKAASCVFLLSCYLLLSSIERKIHGAASCLSSLLLSSDNTSTKYATELFRVSFSCPVTLFCQISEKQATKLLFVAFFCYFLLSIHR